MLARQSVAVMEGFSFFALFRENAKLYSCRTAESAETQGFVQQCLGNKKSMKDGRDRLLTGIHKD